MRTALPTQASFRRTGRTARIRVSLVSPADYYSKFYNLLYEDDNFQEFKERLELDAQLFERDFRRDLDMKASSCFTFRAIKAA